MAKLQGLLRAIQTIVAWLWRWDVVGVGAIAILITGAVSALYGDEPNLAGWLFTIAILWVTVKTLTWDEVRTHPERAWVSLLVVALGAGCFAASMVWIHSHFKVATPAISASAQASSGNTDFRISILGGYTFKPNDRPGITGYALHVQIRNAGDRSSIATDWSVIFITPEGQRLNGQITTPPKSLKLGTLVLNNTDFGLESLSSASPLRVNEPPITSYLLIYVSANQEILLNPATTIEVSAADYSGKRYQADQKIGDWPLPPTHFAPSKPFPPTKPSASAPKSAIPAPVAEMPTVKQSLIDNHGQIGQVNQMGNTMTAGDAPTESKAGIQVAPGAQVTTLTGGDLDICFGSNWVCFLKNERTYAQYHETDLFEKRIVTLNRIVDLHLQLHPEQVEQCRREVDEAISLLRANIQDETATYQTLHDKVPICLKQP